MKISNRKIQYLLCLLIVINIHLLKAEDANDTTSTSNSESTSFVTPPVRSKMNPELNHESSSYVTDPDSIDPLPLQVDSLKDDEEVPIEDIKSLLNDKNIKNDTKKSKVTNKTNKTSTSNNIQKKIQKPKNKTSGQKNKTISKIKIKNKLQESNINQVHRLPDLPNFTLEKRFHYNYKTYNLYPTSDDKWNLALAGKPQVYDVQKGDTLSSISSILFGDSQYWPKIWSMNNPGILNPHLIKPGVKIYFYSGNTNQPPGIAIEDESSEYINHLTGSSVDQNAHETFKSKKIRTEFNQSVIDFKNTKTNPYSDIPKSFSILPSQKILASRNKELTKFSFELKLMEQKERDLPKNPFILTSQKLETELLITNQYVNKVYCKNSNFIPMVEINKKESQENLDIELEASDSVGTVYVILANMTKNLSSLKATYLYKKIGFMNVNSDKSARITECSENINRDVLFVKESVLKQLPEPDEIVFEDSDKILEGVEYSDQQSFYEDQYVILKTQQQTQVGQKYNILSKSEDGKVGSVVVLEARGAYSIGIIHSAEKSLQRHDEVITE